MSSFTELASLPEERIPGSFHTAREIAQQPDVWVKVLDLMEARAAEISSFLRLSGAVGSGDAAVILTGAGSSYFIGRAVASQLRNRLGREVAAVPTTHFVTHPESLWNPRRSYLVVHCARSGDSPESLAAYRFMKRTRADARHLVITCNEGGALAREVKSDPAALVITLPAQTNDRSLAMTSSFTSMALSAVSLGWMDALPRLRRAMEPVRAAARRIMEEHGDALEEFSARAFVRACYLGSDALEGAMHEGALKMLEMTAGRVIAICDSFLGVRHGPQVFINGQCLIVACLSSDPRVRRYEMDLLRELRQKGQGAGMLAISARDDPEIGRIADQVVAPVRPDEEIPDELRIFTDIVACQILAFNASRGLGLMPDNPSPGGVINRVVQGVTIYDP
ncbi:MAG: SIS domain-containing protein [Spirochaetia bacterium]|jgi:tagatose-6-phosphate ketose/aldose isomerase